MSKIIGFYSKKEKYIYFNCTTCTYNEGKKTNWKGRNIKDLEIAKSGEIWCGKYLNFFVPHKNCKYYKTIYKLKKIGDTNE